MFSSLVGTSFVGAQARRCEKRGRILEFNINIDLIRIDTDDEVLATIPQHLAEDIHNLALHK